jgi:hypothetical protein
MYTNVVCKLDHFINLTILVLGLQKGLAYKRVRKFMPKKFHELVSWSDNNVNYAEKTY